MKKLFEWNCCFNGHFECIYPALDKNGGARTVAFQVFRLADLLLSFRSTVSQVECFDRKSVRPHKENLSTAIEKELKSVVMPCKF